MCSWAGGEMEWKRKNVDFLECYSPLPEDQAGENEGERTEGYGRGTTSWLCFLSSKLRYLNYRTKRGLFKDGNRTQYRRGSETNIDGISKSGKGAGIPGIPIRGLMIDSRCEHQILNKNQSKRGQ